MSDPGGTIHEFADKLETWSSMRNEVNERWRRSRGELRFQGDQIPGIIEEIDSRVDVLSRDEDFLARYAFLSEIETPRFFGSGSLMVHRFSATEAYQSAHLSLASCLPEEGMLTINLANILGEGGRVQRRWGFFSTLPTIFTDDDASFVMEAFFEELYQRRPHVTRNEDREEYSNALSQKRHSVIEQLTLVFDSLDARNGFYLEGVHGTDWLISSVNGDEVYGGGMRYPMYFIDEIHRGSREVYPVTMLSNGWDVMRDWNTTEQDRMFVSRGVFSYPPFAWDELGFLYHLQHYSENLRDL